MERESERLSREFRVISPYKAEESFFEEKTMALQHNDGHRKMITASFLRGQRQHLSEKKTRYGDCSQEMLFKPSTCIPI